MVKAFIILLSLLTPNTEMEKDIELYFQKYFSDYLNYEYVITGMPKNYKKIEINADLPYSISDDIVYLPVIVYKTEKETFNSHIVLKVKLYRFALISVDDVQRNTNLSECKFNVAIVDVTKFKDEPIAVQDVDSLRSKMFIEKGSPLLKNMIEEKPVIQAGDAVLLNSKIGSVTIKMNAIARQEGKVDEIIRVKSDDNKLYRAKVLDNKNVLVME